MQGFVFYRLNYESNFIILSLNSGFMKKSKKVIFVMIFYIISCFIGAIIKIIYDIDITTTIAGFFVGFCWYSWYLSVKEQEKEEEI